MWPRFNLGFLSGTHAPTPLSGGQLDAVAYRLGDAATALDADHRTRTFGVEIEFTGITFEQAWRALQAGLQQRSTEPPGWRRPQYTSGWDETDNFGRTWSLKSDSSVAAERGGDTCELVTPPLKLDGPGGNNHDLHLLTQVVDALCAAGAVANRSTGIHVHVDAGGLYTRTATADAPPVPLICLANTLFKIEPLLLQAINQYGDRQSYAAPMDYERLRCLQSAPTLYAAIDRCSRNRYVGFNLQSFNRHGTVELRYFNATLNAQVVRAYALFALALVTYAVTRCKLPRRTPTHAEMMALRLTPTQLESPAYEMRRFLLSLGLSGPAFADVRAVLATALPGHPAFATRAQADAHAARHRGAGAVAPWRTEWPAATPPCVPAPAGRSARRGAASRAAAPTTAPTASTQTESSSLAWYDRHDAMFYAYTAAITGSEFMRSEITPAGSDPAYLNVAAVSHVIPGGARYIVFNVLPARADGAGLFVLAVTHTSPEAMQWGRVRIPIMRRDGHFRSSAVVASIGADGTERGLPQIFNSLLDAAMAAAADSRRRVR